MIFHRASTKRARVSPVSRSHVSTGAKLPSASALVFDHVEFAKPPVGPLAVRGAELAVEVSSSVARHAAAPDSGRPSLRYVYRATYGLGRHEPLPWRARKVASPDGNGHYEHAPLIVHRHGTAAGRASSPTRRPALVPPQSGAARSGAEYSSAEVRRALTTNGLVAWLIQAATAMLPLRRGRLRQARRVLAISGFSYTLEGDQG